MVLGIISLIGIVYIILPQMLCKRIYAFLASVSILWSVGVAARHVWLQNLPPDKVPSCGPGIGLLG